MPPEITRVLFLDDSEQRHETFARAMVGGRYILLQAITAEQAITLLGGDARYDVACLDHDLSEEDIMCPPGGPSRVATGMDVVDHIVSMGHDRRPRFVVVHTHNPPAGDEMMRRLGAAGIPCGRWPFMHMVKIMDQGGLGIRSIPGVHAVLEAQ